MHKLSKCLIFPLRMRLRCISMMLSFLVPLLVSPTSWACSCLAKEPSQYLARCDHLFIATLENINLDKKDGPVTQVTGTFSLPTHIFKGNPADVKGVINTRSGTSCDTFMQVGEEYIVCGKSDAKFTKHTMCGFTHTLYGDEKQRMIEQFSVEPSK
ncbi:hypothetical protein TDB9533_02919 [Thalassocella blandensis]|nr:hypothetical protein TDB9533_02919 [Thalassocella blandensis]